MPWKVCKPMDERLKFIARLLDGEKMAVACREFGLVAVLQRLWQWAFAKRDKLVFI